MNTIKKLETFKKSVQDFRVADREFYNLIGLKLYNFIQSNPTLRKEFEYRSKYLRDLDQSKELLSLEASLHKRIIKMLKLFDKTFLQQVQKEWNNKLLNPFLNDSEHEISLLTFYKLALRRNNYRRLNSNNPLSIDEEISFFTPTKAVIRQYKTINYFFNILTHYLPNGQETLRKKVEYQSSEYLECYHQLEQMLYFIPISLDTFQFEAFFYLCQHVSPIKGYEFVYDKLSNNLVTLYPIKKAKKCSITVIDNLIDILEQGHYTKDRISIDRANRRGLEKQFLFRCGQLVLDLQRCSLTYKMKSISISPATQDTKLLKLLIQHSDKLVKVLTICKLCEIDSKNLNDSVTRRYVSTIRRNLVNKLAKVGLPKSIMKELIESKRTSGMILHSKLLR